jgi:hypothetical protein
MLWLQVWHGSMNPGFLTEIVVGARRARSMGV